MTAIAGSQQLPALSQCFLRCAKRLPGNFTCAISKFPGFLAACIADSVAGLGRE